MEERRVKSVEHLRELIGVGIYRYFICFGILRSSKWIELNRESGEFEVFNECDGSWVNYTAEELSTDYYPIGKAIIKGALYYD